MSFLGGFAPGNGGLSRIAALEAQVGDSGIQFLSGSADPSAGAGVPASQPAFYARTDGSSISSLWIKQGVADTAWSHLVEQVFAGTATAERYVASLIGSASAPAFTVVDNEGIYAEAADTLSVAAGGLRFLRARSSGVDVLNTIITFNQYMVGSAVQNTNLTATTNDLAVGAVKTLYLTSTGAQTLTSITGGMLGRELVIINGNASDVITLQDDDGALGTAANRFIGAGGLDVPIAAGGGVMVDYRADSRWHIILP